MTLDATTTWLIAVAGLVVVVVQVQAATAGLAEARKEVSRYKLYEARDELIRIVVSGAMEESDKSWAYAYAAVNDLLNIHERLDLYAVLKRYARFLRAVKANPQLQREIELKDRSMKRASRDVPQFRAALAEMEVGFYYAMRRQTSLWQSLAFLLALAIYGALPVSTTPGALSTWAQNCRA